MTRVFFIGGTGYIGCALLQDIVQRHPDVAVRVLVRAKDKATRLKAKYPSVQTVIGDLDSYKLLEEESKQADIVINTAPDITHEDGVAAILDGMRDHGPDKSFYIHTSGASNVWDEPIGNKDAKFWDDMDDVEKIMSLEEDYTHFDIDEIVREAASEVNVVNISPVSVYGLSPSPDHPVPMACSAVVQIVRNLKAGFQIAEGENQVGCIDIGDLKNVYMMLFEHALAGNESTDQGVPIWGPQAYYYAVGEIVTFHDHMAKLLPALVNLGVIPSTTEIKSLTARQVARLASDDYDSSDETSGDAWAAYITICFGVNMRVRASRMQRLGWKPVHGSVTDNFEETYREYLRLEKELKKNKNTAS